MFIARQAHARRPANGTRNPHSTLNQRAVGHNNVVTRRNTRSTNGRYHHTKKCRIAVHVDGVDLLGYVELVTVTNRPVVARTFTDCMEQLQEGYVAAVAATAGCTVQPIDKDLYGTDIMIVRSGESYIDEEVSVLAQLKNTTTIAVDPSKAAFSYTIKQRKHFEKLAMYRKSLQSIIIVMTTTPDQRDWTKGSHDALEIQYCCYW